MPPHIFWGGAAGGAALSEALGAALAVGGGKITPPGGGSCAGGVEGVQAAAPTNRTQGSAASRKLMNPP
jgi:hypothetical protein